jgi:integrase
MGRRATGCVRYLAGGWHAKWRLADGPDGKPRRSKWLAIGEGLIAKEDRDAAEAEAERLAPRMRKVVQGGEVPHETFSQWFERFHTHKQSLGLSTVKDMRGRASKWILPGIEDKAMTDVSPKDVEAVVRLLDRAVAAFQKDGPGKGRLSPSTAKNVWGDMQHAFDEAVRAKEPSLRVLTESPAKNVRGPDGGDERQGQILYSDEILSLVSHPDVPLYRRQTYALAIYSKARSSELEALTSVDVDLPRKTVTISKQADRKSKGRKETKRTKTKLVRIVDIEPSLLPLVTWLASHPQGKHGRLLRMPPPEDRAELLRADLLVANVKRDALHIEHDPGVRAIVFHDLRDTGLVHMAVRGDSPILIQWAGGHTDYKTTQGYVSRGQTERQRIGTPLPPLPPDLCRESKAPIKSRTIDDDGISLNSAAFLRPQRELNPCYRRERPVS